LNSLIDFGVACYPSRFDPELSKKLAFPMFAAFGEKDSMLPMEQVEALRSNVKDSMFETKIEVYSELGMRLHIIYLKMLQKNKKNFK
jgi:dienelactone hydrolase